MKYNYYDETNWKNIDFSKDVNFGKWVFQPKESNESISVPTPLTDEQMIDEILGHPDLEDKGFFEDMVAWIRMDAPKKLRTMLTNLCPWTTGLGRASADLSYKMLCRVVYEMGFRASEVLERRMTLGQNNEWVRKYFGDFPPRG